MESEHEDKAKETVNDTADDTKAESLQSVNALLWQQHSQTSLSESSPPISTTGRPPLGPSPLSRSNSKQQGLVMSTLEEDNISKSEGTLLHSHKEDSKKSFPPVEDSPPKVISESENPKRRSSKLSHEPSALVMNTHLTPEQIQGYMVYTHTQSIPKKGTTLREYRSIFRLLQALTSAGAFATIFYSSIVNAHQSFVLSESGVSLMCLTSISAFLIAFTFVIVYLFPYNFNISPHRHPRFSYTEVILDQILIGLWLASSSVLLMYGRCNPKVISSSGSTSTTINSGGGNATCPEWIPPLALGYLATLLFGVTCCMGLADLYDQWSGSGTAFHTKDHIMFARGDWKD